MKGALYDAAFYAEGRRAARASARRVVPRLLELVPAASVVDLGCGVGSWLSVFAENGAGEVLGVDGEHVARGELEIPAARFRAHDFEAPFACDRRFDLAMSVEVAEHLPATAADGFVDALCGLSDVVLFSAAVPSQGGVEHVNEQWPDYWADRFAARGYRCVDALRDELWTDPEVSWWYAQNLLVFATDAALGRHPKLANAGRIGAPRRLVHPTLVERNLHRARLREAQLQLMEHVPAGSTALLADGGQLFGAFAAPVARHATWRPFLERDGAPWGSPPDGATAVAELTRMREEGAEWLALLWTCSWWLDCYAELDEHLAVRARRAFASDELVVFDLRG